MDVLADLLSRVRVCDAMFGLSIVSPPWSLEFRHDATLTLCSVLSGDGWAVLPGVPPARLATWDIAVVRGDQPFVLADDPATPPQVICYDSRRCTTADGVDVSVANRLEPRTYGTRPDGPVRFLVCAYLAKGEVSARLLDALPPVLVLPGAGGRCPPLDMIADELARDVPGQQALLDRLLDVLLVSTLRDWFSQHGAGVPGWYRGLGDPVVGAALRAVHGAPDQPWTVGSLAAAVGVARATLAKRFTALVGVPPLTYLTEWRMAVAADLLREPSSTVAHVARQVGYTDSFAFSAAFKRTKGVSPREHRMRKD